MSVPARPAPPAPAAPSGAGRGPSPARRIVLRVAGVVLGAATALIAALQAVSGPSGGTTTVMIGALRSSELIMLATLVALVCLAVGLCAIPVRRVWLLLLVPARLAAVAVSGAGVLLAGLLLTSATTVPLVSAGCDTGYVVREDAFLFATWGDVYRMDGILATKVARTSGDDGYQPFAEGAYAVTEEGGALRVWYDIVRDPYAGPVRTQGDPAFTLPVRADRVPGCGIAVPTRAPRATPAPVPTPPSAVEARMTLDERVAATVDAAVGPVRDATGEVFAPSSATPVTVPCDGGGERRAVALDLATADNAASLDRILAAWDTAGYARDRAMQEDIRYSDSLPVDLLSARDTTSVDGLLHLRITTRCTAPAG